MNPFDFGYDRGRYPDGVQDFATLRNSNMVYVDKTALIYELTRKPVSYFLSRPRRFGKSLLLSTISAYFEARKELFDGLAIADLEKDWVQYPVIRIDLSRGIFTSEEGSIVRLFSQLKSNAERLNVKLEDTTPDGQFYELIEKLYQNTGRQVVVLIDEYDKPLLETMYDSEELHTKMHALMRGFYGCLKAASAYLRFVMITGITKVQHVNIFSGLNNLTDISLQPWCNALCGISESEMQQYFEKDMHTFARINQLETEEVKTQFKLQYDGYLFSRYGENIYNPYSVILAFQSMTFSNYWFATGTPGHLVRALNNEHFDFSNLEGYIAEDTELMGVATTDGNPIGLLYQSGYLTIKGYDGELYTLGFPNAEVKSGFYEVLLQVLYPSTSTDGFSAINFRKSARQGKPTQLVQLLDKALIAYNYDQHKDLDGEAVLNSVLFGLVHALGLNVKAEYHISNGRIDMVIETNHFIYLFEFKIDKTASEAMTQINEKAYANKYKYDHRKLYKIAINYNTRLRQIDDHLIE